MNTTTRALLTTLTTLLPLCLMIGCSGAQAPTFEAVGVKEVDRNDQRSVIAFTVRATNPNREPIPLREVSYRVSIGGDVVFEGIRSPETTLNDYSSSEFVLPAVVPLDLLHGSIDYTLMGSVRYIPPGRLSEVLFDADIKVPEASLDIHGSIDAGN